MCGIIGYIGNKNAKNMLHYGLKHLEYRGYDSAGIAYYDNSKIKLLKSAGSVDSLFDKAKNVFCTIGIGHTRWATHGVATNINSHPHSSKDGKVVLVHNGIIENYIELKQKYNIKCVSDTDTEVAANVIEHMYNKCGNKLKAIENGIKEFKGSFALCILFDGDADSIYFAKSVSPMLIGKGKNEMYVSSDILGFGHNADMFADISDGVYGFVTKNDVKAYKCGKLVKLNFTIVPDELQSAELGGYPHYMLKEITEIPVAISNTIALYKSKKSPFLKLNNITKNITRVRLIACGTSYHACLIGEKLLNDIGIDATTHIASELLCDGKTINKNTLCIFVSQSGETADTLSAVKMCKQKHAKTLCITNVPTSTITKLCNWVLPIKCGAEIAVASTKAYNCQLVALYSLTAFIEGKLDKTLNALARITKLINIKDIENTIKPVIKQTLYAKNVLMVGKNCDYVTALESSLKLKEISYIPSQAYPSGELKHGTIALVDSGTLVVAFMTEKDNAAKTYNIVKQTESRGAKIVAISSIDDVINDKQLSGVIKLPKMAQKYYPIISVIPMQLIAYRVSTSLGYNPDKPRNLAKSVTVE